MNKFFIIIVSLLIVSLVVYFVIFKNNKSNKELELTYKMSAGIPFKRVYEIEDESIVSLVKSYISKDENTGGKVGAPVYTTYVFKGLKEGETTITFKVINISDENDVMSEDKNIVKVDKNLNIYLVKDSNE